MYHNVFFNIPTSAVTSFLFKIALPLYCWGHVNKHYFVLFSCSHLLGCRMCTVHNTRVGIQTDTYRQCFYLYSYFEFSFNTEFRTKISKKLIAWSSVQKYSTFDLWFLILVQYILLNVHFWLRNIFIYWKFNFLRSFRL